MNYKRNLTGKTYKTPLFSKIFNKTGKIWKRGGNLLFFKLSSILLDVFFQESEFASTNEFSDPGQQPCRPDLICTTPLFSGGSLCTYDSGGPLFMAHCGSSKPR